MTTSRAGEIDTVKEIKEIPRKTTHTDTHRVSAAGCCWAFEDILHVEWIDGCLVEVALENVADGSDGTDGAADQEIVLEGNHYITESLCYCCIISEWNTCVS